MNKKLQQIKEKYDKIKQKHEEGHKITWKERLTVGKLQKQYKKEKQKNKNWENQEKEEIIRKILELSAIIDMYDEETGQEVNTEYLIRKDNTQLIQILEDAIKLSEEII